MFNFDVLMFNVNVFAMQKGWIMWAVRLNFQGKGSPGQSNPELDAIIPA